MTVFDAAAGKGLSRYLLGRPQLADMPWGERIAFVEDPEGNVVTLAMPAR